MRNMELRNKETAKMSPTSNKMCAFATSALQEYIILEVLLKLSNL